MLKKGIKIEIPDFASVKPTYTHMILNELLNKNIIKHITVRKRLVLTLKNFIIYLLQSQNCDGLHLRSITNINENRCKLSELHGNCFVEQCLNCNQEYIRDFDVTSNSKV